MKIKYILNKNWIKYFKTKIKIIENETINIRIDKRIILLKISKKTRIEKIF